MSDTIAIVAHEDGSILPVVAQPGARRNGVLGVRAGALRVAVTAPPDKGKANAATQDVLAEALGCKTAQLALVAGATSRQKRFRVAGIDPVELRRRLSALISKQQITGVSRRATQREGRRIDRFIYHSRSLRSALRNSAHLCVALRETLLSP